MPSSFKPSPNVSSGPTVADGTSHQFTGSVFFASTVTASIGISPLGTGANSVQVGDGAIVASGAGSIAVGKAANAAAAGAVAIGDSAKADNGTGYGVALGYAADAGGLSSIAIGASADASATEAIAIGAETTTATAASSISLGAYADSTGAEAIAIGKTAQATAADAIAIGDAAAASQTDAIAIGDTAAASNTDTVAIGRSTVASQPNAIAIGVAAKGQHSNTISMGHGAKATVTNSIAFGSGTLNQTANTMTIGNAFQKMDLNVTGNVAVWNGALIASDSETVGGTASPGNISATKMITYIDDSDNTSGTSTFALAVGVAGQIKIITMTVATGGGGTDPYLGSTNIVGVANKVTWSDAGDTLLLVCNGSKWAVAGSYGVAFA